MNAPFSIVKLPLDPTLTQALRPLKRRHAIEMGYSPDPRKRRRQHRRAARQLLAAGSLLNPRAVPGTLGWDVAQWHLAQARMVR